jgi:hypothetical protein
VLVNGGAELEIAVWQEMISPFVLCTMSRLHITALKSVSNSVMSGLPVVRELTGNLTGAVIKGSREV